MNELDSGLLSSYQVIESPENVAQGQNSALDFSINLLQEDRRHHKPAFYPGMLMDIHHKLLHFLPGWAGQYRANDDTRVGNNHMRLVPADKLKDEVFRFEVWIADQISELKKNPEDLEGAIKLASAAQYLLLAHFHPFEDGNGRVARILTNMILMMNAEEFAVYGQPIIPLPILRERIDTQKVIKTLENNKEPQLTEYLNVLRQVDGSSRALYNRTLNPLEGFIAGKWQLSLIDFYLKMQEEYGIHWRRKLDPNSIEFADKLIERSVLLGKYKHTAERKNHRGQLISPDYVPKYTPIEL